MGTGGGRPARRGAGEVVLRRRYLAQGGPERPPRPLERGEAAEGRRVRRPGRADLRRAARAGLPAGGGTAERGCTRAGGDVLPARRGRLHRRSIGGQGDRDYGGVPEVRPPRDGEGNPSPVAASPVRR